jgi:hypothetical protein
LEVAVFFLLRNHAHLEVTIEGLDQRGGSLGDLFINVLNFSLHGVQLLPEKLDQLVVLLQVTIGLASEVLPSVIKYLHHAEVTGCVRGILRILLGRVELAHAFIMLNI